MKTTEQRIRRLEIWNRVLLTLLVLFVVGSVGNFFLQKKLASLQSLSVYQQPDGEVRFYSISDAPRIVTHLVKYGDNEGEKRVALLPQPLVIVDSSGARITAQEVKKLAWINIYGQPVAPPATGAKIEALYISALTASVAD